MPDTAAAAVKRRAAKCESSCATCPLAGWCAVFLSNMLVLSHGLFCSLSPFAIRSQMFAAEENVDFRIHVENQTRARDDVSRKQLRLYQLYSRTSGKHIQVLGRRISAKGEDGDKYGKNIYWDPPDSGSKDFNPVCWAENLLGEKQEE